MTDPFAKDELVATMRCRPDTLLPCKLDWPVERIRYFGADPVDSRPLSASTWSDGWGVTWRKESADPEMMPFPVGHPLHERLDELSTHAWPNPADPRLFVDLIHVRHSMDRLLIGEHPFALYERAWLLTGMQHLLLAMEDEPARVEELFERIAGFELSIARRYIDLGVEAAWVADDYGMNSGLMFSPAAWRRFVRPHLKRLVDLYHQAGALVILHSCGNITGLIEDFLKLGIDVLDPLQPSCNRLEDIRRKTQGRICLCGGVESSALLAGDAAETEIRTRERIALLGSEGGYIVGPDDDWIWPDATREAMLRAVGDYREAVGNDRADC